MPSRERPLSGVLRRASVRHLVHHPWQVGLSILGIALGLAVVLSIDLANESARRSFALFTQGIAGRATHHLVGGPGGVPETLYRTLRVDLAVRAAAPVVEREVAAPDLPGVTFHLMGVDPFAEAPFRSFLGDAPAPGAALATLMTRPGAALVARDTARRLGLGAGDSIAIRVGAVRRRVTVVGEMVPRDALSARALETMLVTDIATAQEVLGERGRLSRIDLAIGDDAGGREMLGRVTAALPPGAQLVPAGARSAAVEQMTRAFRINLTALSLLALVVGMFLIYNAMTFSVVQRRELFEDAAAAGEIFGPGVRELQMTGGAREQPGPEPLLELLHVAADHGLRQAQVLGRRREAAAVRDGDEGFDARESVHARLLYHRPPRASRARAAASSTGRGPDCSLK